jgi:ribonuclease D
MPTFIGSDAALRAWLPRLEAAVQVAVDCEFHTERTYRPRLMLLQLAADGGEPLLVDPISVSLQPLASALSQPTLLTHSGGTDLQILHDACGLRPRRVFDTQVAAGCCGLGYPTRLADVARQVTGEDMAKGETLSDWSARPLSAEQVRYAADDVRVLGPLAAALAARVASLGNDEACEGGCAELVRGALARPDALDAWRSVQGAQVLDAAERSALRAIAAWRDREAAARDVPRHSLVGDALLLDIARRRPTSLDGLRANRRMPGAVWKSHGPALLAALAVASAEAPPAVHPRGRAWSDVVRAAGRVVEAQRGVAVDLLLDDETLARLAGGERAEGWRAGLLDDAFYAFLSGAGALRLPPGLTTPLRTADIRPP